MNYYLKDNIILKTEADLSNENCIPLTSEQIAFYLLNENVSICEILNCKLNEIVERNLEVEKEMFISIVSNNYTQMMNENFDSVLTPLAYDGFKLGYEKCSATMSWCVQKTEERITKINAIKDAQNFEELSLISCEFENKTKPYSAEELFYECMCGQ